MLLKKFISMDRDTKNKQISCDSWWLIKSVVPYVRYNQKKKNKKTQCCSLAPFVSHYYGEERWY